MSFKFEVLGNSKERVDLFLAKKLPEFSRSYIQKTVEEGNVLVNSKPTKSSQILNLGDTIDINIADQALANELVGEEINLNIAYEDENVIVVNKQPGLVVHPGSGNRSGTLVNALIHHFPPIKDAVYDPANPISKARPGLVHRLDKDTSGVMIVAKNARALHSLAKQIQNRTVKKTYFALCYGWPREESGNLVNYLGRHPKNRRMMADIGPAKGKEAISEYGVIDYLSDSTGDKVSLIKLNILTGRTHQIRVQTSLIHHPVLGDLVYGSKESIALSKRLNIDRQLLHAKTLEVYLPGDNKTTIFDAPLPDDFAKALTRLHSINKESA